MRGLVRYFGLLFLQYMAVAAAFLAVVVLGCRYTRLSLFETYSYMLPSLGVWLTPMTLAGSRASTDLPIYFGVRRCHCFICIQVLAVGMSLCTVAMAAGGMAVIGGWISDYGMEMSGWSLPVIFAASLAESELFLLIAHLPRGAGQRIVSVASALILIGLVTSTTLSVLKDLDFPLPLFPSSVLRPGWLAFTVVCGLAAAALGTLCWRYFRKAVIRL